MGSLFQDSGIPEIMPDPPEGVRFFPVRHHSPVCAYQLRNYVRGYQPELILIEGPENANDLIPVLTDEHTTLPAAIYYFYKDKKQYVSEEAEDYHCYYPFLYSSPEYAAMDEAKRLGIPARFIDLPYSEILIHTSESAGLRREQERHSYADDSHLVQSRFYQKICEKTGLRNFEEFWEKYFEIAGLRLTPEAFLWQMFTYCTLTRESIPPEQMEQDGTNAREQHMAYRIREAMQQYKRILVVTGGSHSGALARLVRTAVKPIRLHKFSEGQEGCYPIAYSYEAADALNGYASGMQHPGFYDKVTQALADAETPEGIYVACCLDLLTKTAKASAKKDIPVSISDITAAWSLAEGLAALRGSAEPGFAEVWDGVTGALIKGEKTVAAAVPLELLIQLGAGEGIGHIGDTKHVPPLIQDLIQTCAVLRLKADTAVPQEAEISLFTGEKELAKSHFLHRMVFLGTGFCKRKKGPDLHAGKDRSRVREVWSYCRSPQVDAVLVERTTDGATIAEACRSIAAKRIRQERRCAIAAGVCVDCFLMGIALTGEDVTVMEEILAGDGDLFSLGKGLQYFDMLHELRQLYRAEDPSLLRYITQCFQALLIQLPSMAQCPAEQAQDCIRICRLLYGITGRLLTDRRAEFREALISLTERPDKEPSVFGAAMGLLYAMDAACLQQAEAAMQGYLMGSQEMRKQGALYLKGLFETARDIVLGESRFLEMTDALLSGMDHADLMEILPSMRLAFSYFTPSETQQIAEAVSALHGGKADQVLHEAALDELLCAFGAELDAEIFREMRANGGN